MRNKLLLAASLAFARAFACVLAFVLALPLAGAAQAQNWPERSIRLIVPFPAGGPNDIIARVVSQKMSETLGQTIVIDNRGGAGGVTGTDAVAKAAPDGYTIGITSLGALAIASSIQKVAYHSTKGLTPVTLVAKVPELLVVPAELEARTLADLVKLAKSKPGAMNYASTGPGGLPHLAAELLKSVAGIDVVHLPYKGAAPAVNDLVAGRTQFMFADIPVLLPHVQSGKLRALAVGSAARAPALPDVATTAELGLPKVEAENWYGMVAPPGLPAAILDRLHKTTVAAMADAGVTKRLSALGAVLSPQTPAQFSAFIEAETAKWAMVVKQAKIGAP